MQPMAGDQASAESSSFLDGMPVGKHLGQADMARLINHMALCRLEPTKWAFFHAKIVDESQAQIGELIQLFEQSLMGNGPVILKLTDAGQVFALCNTIGQRSITAIEADIIQGLRFQNVPLQSGALTEKALYQIEKILSPLLAPDDMPARIALKRFARHGNMFMVLDDDQVVLRQLDHMLKNYGHVETHETARDFLAAYSRYAPNAVFVDIHLKGDRGTNVSSLLSEKFDPGGYVVMISADAIKPNVVESKSKGAKGFIGKPVSMEMVLRHLSAIPTMYKR